MAESAYLEFEIPADAKFCSVHCSPATGDYGKNDCGIYVFVDGSRVMDQIFRKRDARLWSVAGIQETRLYLKPFQFSRLLLTDKESARADEATLKELGTIRITKEAVQVQKSHPQSWQPEKTSIANTGPIHEKAKKAGSHRTKLGEAIPSRAPASFNMCTCTPLGFPIHEFVFQYASLDWLQAQEIAPRADPPPSPPQPPVPKNSVKRERSPSLDLDQSDVKFLDPDDVAHITRIKNKLASRKKAKVKEEPGIKVPRDLLHADTVIDLTSDGE